MHGLRRILTPWRALLLAALLLAAQAAGLAHRVAHGPTAHGGSMVAAFWGHAAVDGQDHPASEAAAECRLYDQLLGHADALIGAAPRVANPAPAPEASRRDGICRGRSAAAPYQARAPPLT